MIKMAFEKLTTDPDTLDQLVLLRSTEGEELFHLPIDGAEALAIYLSLTRKELPLPLEHEATEEVLTRLDAEVEEIQILDLDEFGVYTEVVIGFRGGKLRMEVCPGDSIALALKYSAPIYLSEHLTPGSPGFLADPEDDLEDLDALLPDDPMELEAEPGLDEEVETPAPGEGLTLATDAEVQDAIEDLLRGSSINPTSGRLEPDRESEMQTLSDQLRDAIHRESYEEAGRLMAEIIRMERGETV